MTILSHTYEEPLADKINLPVGPFKLSIQPGNGSFRAAVTIEGRTIAKGTSPHSFSKIFSANALVKVYVFGYGATILRRAQLDVNTVNSLQELLQLSYSFAMLLSKLSSAPSTKSDSLMGSILGGYMTSSTSVLSILLNAVETCTKAYPIVIGMYWNN